MKNPYGVEPTCLMKKKESDCAIVCSPRSGPIFGNYIQNGDLIIGDPFHQEDSCFIHNDGKHAYECHPEYKSSLFVNTAGPNEMNKFSVLDFEVYTH